jgi:hypothetical protein
MLFPCVSLESVITLGLLQDSDNDNNDEQPAAAAPRDAVAQRNLCVLSVAGINSEQPINSAPAIRWTRHVYEIEFRFIHIFVYFMKCLCLFSWDLNSESPHKQIPIELVEPEAIDIFMRFRHDKDALSAELLQHFGSQLRQFMPVEPVSVSKSTKTSKRGSANKSPGTKAVKSKASKQSSSVKCTRCDIVGHNSSNLACPLMSPEDREARKKRAQCLKVVH